MERMTYDILNAGPRNRFCVNGRIVHNCTGDGPQPTNLPNSGPAVSHCRCGAYHCMAQCPSCLAVASPPREWSPEAAEFALDLIRHKSMHLLQFYFGDAMAAVSACLRPLFIARPGYDLIGSDYSSIEAVVIAELAGETWRQEVFRTHGKIYELSAAKISGIPFEEFMIHYGYSPRQLAVDRWWEEEPENKGSHHKLRKTHGKVAELALGYQGWIGSMLAFGADEFMDEGEMKAAILQWRAASPNIVEFWGGQERDWRTEYYGVEGMFIQAILNPGAVYEYRGHQFQMRGDALYLKLVSGRELTYHRPRLDHAESPRRGYAISYEGQNSNPKNGPVGWIRMRTWGGRLVENIVQATARDILRRAVILCEQNEYPIVLHVYDELVAEVPEGFRSVEGLERLMMAVPEWAAGWPIRAAKGWRGKRYRKG